MALAPTPEALMRSRYSAFALGGMGAYLLETWDTRYRDPALTARILDQRDSDWLGLEILATSDSGNQGTVDFKATYRPLAVNSDTSPQILHERSRFKRHGGAWRYLDGLIDPPPSTTPVSRNAPCPCGSGKKAKRCCLG